MHVLAAVHDLRLARPHFRDPVRLKTCICKPKNLSDDSHFTIRCLNSLQFRKQNHPQTVVYRTPVCAL